MPLLAHHIEGEITKFGLKKAVAQHIEQYCALTDLKINIDAKNSLVQSPFYTDEWFAEINNNKIAGGVYGKEIISLTYSPCDDYSQDGVITYILDKSKKVFIRTNEYILTDSKDGRGLPFFAGIFYLVLYPFIFLSGASYCAFGKNFIRDVDEQ